MPDHWTAISARLVTGHGVASGRAEDCPYDGGSLRHQLPHFRQLGVPLGEIYPGTLNLDTTPCVLELLRPSHTIRKLKWHEAHPPETFSFSRCRVRTESGETVDGWIYRPHPETKQQHFQPAGIVEVIAPLLPRIRVGSVVELNVDEREVRVRRESAGA